MNRRDLLALFGVGASVVPLLGGAPQLAAESKLIETPKVEPIIEPQPRAMLANELLQSPSGQIQVSYTAANGQRYWFTADTFLTEVGLDTIEIGSKNGTREFMPGRRQMTWQLRGVFIGAGPAFYAVNSPRDS